MCGYHYNKKFSLKIQYEHQLTLDDPELLQTLFSSLIFDCSYNPKFNEILFKRT